jgi:Putative zinc-finger
MNCQQVRENFWEYQRRQLARELAERVGTHLQSCAACALEFDRFQQVDESLEGFPSIEPSPYFDQKLNARMATLNQQRSSFLGPWWKDRYVWTFAVLFLVAVGLWLGFRHQQSRRLNSMEDVLNVQDGYLGNQETQTTPRPGVAIKEESPDIAKPEPGGNEEELIPEDDLAVVENLELLQNYDFLSKFDLADSPANRASPVKAN